MPAFPSIIYFGRALRDEYFAKTKELSNLMKDSLNWFDYFQLEI